VIWDPKRRKKSCINIDPEISRFRVIATFMLKKNVFYIPRGIPFKFFYGAGLRARVQAIVYKYAPNNIADLRQRIIRGFQEIRTDLNVSHRVRNSFDRRMRAYIRAEGDHFEHLI
jgi:hypothetical protein